MKIVNDVTGRTRRGRDDLLLDHDAGEEPGARDVPRARDHGGHVGVDLPGEVVLRAGRKDVQQHERDEQKRDDERAEHAGLLEDSIVAMRRHGLFHQPAAAGVAKPGQRS